MNRAFSSTKSNVRPRAAAFNFKSSERAERRKEVSEMLSFRILFCLLYPRVVYLYEIPYEIPDEIE